MKKYLALAAAGLMILTGCAATPEVEAKTENKSTVEPSNVEEESDAPPDVPEDVAAGTVGTTFTITSDEGAGEITLTKARNVKPGEYDSKATNGRYLEVTITAVATEGMFAINPFDFALTDAEGTEYDQTFMVDAAPDLNHRELRKGQKAKGAILFDAPKGAVQLAYRGNLFSGEDLGIWSLK